MVIDSHSKPKVAVIGAGLGGLSCAIRLASAGFPVDVYDKQDFAGGKAGSETISGYRFDTGPSLFTMHHVFAELFSQAGEDIRDYLDLIPLEIICTYFFSDGTVLRAYGKPERFAEECRQVLGVPVEQVLRFLDYSAKIYDTSAELFLERSLHEAGTYLSRTFFRSLFRLGRIDPMRTMNRAIESFFEEPRMRQLFERYATYNGSDPFRTPATLNIIPHLEYNLGAYALGGGIYSIAQALEKLARKKSVEFHLSTQVDRIIYGSGGLPGKVKGIEVNGTFHPYTIVVSNVDVTPTYRDLLGDEEASAFKRYKKLEPSSSGLVYYWGMKNSNPELGLNNIFFSEDYSQDFIDIFEKKRCPVDPTVYVNITSKHSREDAPGAGENWFILVNAPYDDGQDWTDIEEEFREKVIGRVSRGLGRDISRDIACEGRMNPLQIQEKTGSNRGSLYGIASNSKMAAFLRHRNRSTRYPGLYFCGGSAHPGGGMPLVVLSGKITADLIKDRTWRCYST